MDCSCWSSGWSSCFSVACPCAGQEASSIERIGKATARTNMEQDYRATPVADCVAPVLSTAFLLEGQRRRVDAIAQSRRPRPIGEDVAQVPSAVCAGDFNAAHPEGVVLVLVNGLGIRGNHKAGPSASGVELRPGKK